MPDNQASPSDPFIHMHLLRTSLFLAALGGIVAAPVHAARVQEVRMQDLPAFLAKNDTVVVQFTSPDPKCRYCIGADKAFDAAVAPARDARVKYVRVQWPVWHKFPDFGKLTKPIGLPEQMVFRRGTAIGTVSGRLHGDSDLLAKVAQIQANPKHPGDFYREEQPTVPAAAAPTAPATPMSAEELRLTRLLARKDLLAGIASYCGRLPGSGASLQQALDGWTAKHKTELDRASLVMLSRSSREDAAATSAIVREETGTLSAWTRSLGIPADRNAALEDCEKIARGFAAMPPLAAR